MAKRSENKKNNKKNRRFSPTWTWVGAILIVAALSGIATALSLGQLKTGLPDLKVLEDYRPITTSRFYADDGLLIAELSSERRILVSLEDIAPVVTQAFIAVEDKRFFNHRGIDPKSIARATIRNILSARVVEGGSTITQQVAKNLFLSQDRTFKRKIKEALLALEIERRYSKREILRVYLNQIYFGYGAYGVEEAARTYFGKSAR
ncbi:MAG TPA: transglycosylase domain-containing protein, partial [bacterium]|nr:transglycosylase domain-containing protein [bacterium]